LISGERAKILARMIGISEKVVDEAADEIFHCSQSRLVTYDAFQTFYFEMFTRV